MTNSNARGNVRPQSSKGGLTMKKTKVLLDTLAYKVSAKRFKVLLNALFTPMDVLNRSASFNEKSEEEKITYLASLGTLEMELTGLQFSFEGSGAIEISQVYLFKNEQRYVRISLKDYPMEEIILSELKEENMFLLMKVNNNGSEAHHILDTECTDTSFENLDYFQSSIGFVYFSIDSIKAMIYRYAASDGYIIISGSEINLGKKLSHNDNANFNYESPYFTLKMEGEAGNVNTLLAISDEEGTMVEPDAAIGFPCPPRWYDTGDDGGGG